MTGDQLKALEGRLWKAADELRANSKLTATEYSFPVLGIIFLRHAYNRFVIAKIDIERSLPVHPTRGVRPMTKNDFLEAKAIFLPETLFLIFGSKLLKTGLASDDDNAFVLIIRSKIRAAI